MESKMLGGTPLKQLPGQTPIKLRLNLQIKEKPGAYYRSLSRPRTVVVPYHLLGELRWELELFVAGWLSAARDQERKEEEERKKRQERFL